MTRTALVASACALVLALSACGGGNDSEPSASTDGQALDGAALYGVRCASCHGEDLRGTRRGPSHLSQVYAPDHHPDEAFVAAARSGVTAHHWNFGNMPPVAGVTDDELTEIIAYIRAEQRREGFEPYPP